MTTQLTMHLEDYGEEVVSNEFCGFEQNCNWADEFGTYLRSQNLPAKPIKTLSLFSGAGGLDIGFFDVGFEIVEKVEIEDKFVETLRHNSGAGKYFGQSSTHSCVDINDYFPTIGPVDFIIGGPPCQPFSAAGARASGVAGTRDDQGNLFREYVRVLKVLSPEGFLFENVYRIVGANGGRDWQAIINEFTRAGYQLHYRILDTADYGVPQHRERLIIVGVRNGAKTKEPYNFPRPTHGPDSLTNLPHYTSAQALSGASVRGINEGLKGKYGHLLAEIPPGLNYSYFTEKMGHPRPIFAWRSKFSDFLYKADPEMPVRTLKALGGQYTGPFHWEGRPFTIAELKRLQTFPDNYEIVGTKIGAVKQIGNSVPPQFARILALSILEQIFGQPVPIKLANLAPSENLSFRKRKRQLTERYKAVAQKAISQLGDQKKAVQALRYRADLEGSLGWQILENGPLYLVENLADRLLRISVSEREGDENEKFVLIRITPRSGWGLPFDKVELGLPNYSDRLFTSAWKAFEHFLSRNNLRADLVQLSGYYQYACAFRSELNINDSIFDNEPFVAFLRELSEGKCINQLLSHADIVRQFDLPEGQVIEYLVRLKRMGFEVRSSATNKAVPKGSFIIPYHFPTLTEKSVQRTKELIYLP